MKHFFTLLLLAFALQGHATAPRYEQFFCDSTLRLDYIFAGDRQNQAIYLDHLSSTPRWYGRHTRLDELPREGNGQIVVKSSKTGEVIYRHSFSTLFQEWLSTEESTRVKRSFQNVFLVPYPREAVDITVTINDYHARPMATMTHTVNPADVLIHHQQPVSTPRVFLQQPADTNRCIRIAFMAEGYTREEMPQYLAHCREAVDALFAHEPFTHLRDRFQIVAVETPSEDSGVSQPSDGIWRNTALGSHFDTFYSVRYLTTLNLSHMHDLIAGLPYEHLIILANTEHYGGGGIYNSYNLSFTRGDKFRPVVVHEFGHSFAGLGDEYPYGEEDPIYFSDVEPWEPNLTTLAEKPVKWQDLIDKGKAGLYEGGGYLTKGIWRPTEDCRMRTNEEPNFCPVCQRAIEQLIDFYTR